MNRLHSRVRVAACLATALGSMTFPSATAAEFRRPADSTVLVISDEALAGILGHPRIDIVDTDRSAVQEALDRAQAAVSRRGSDRLARHADRAQPWHDILFTTEDWDSRDIPTRWGDYTRFGFAKIESVHNISNPEVIQGPYHGRPDKTEGHKRTYC